MKLKHKTIKTLAATALLCAYSNLFASDPITLDSLLKNENGLRSITSIDIVSNNGAQNYSTYPDLFATINDVNAQSTKSGILTQTLMYGATSKLDLILSASASTSQIEFQNSGGGYTTTNNSAFSSTWLGGSYQFDALDVFVPTIMAQTAVFNHSQFNNASTNVSFKDYYAKAAIKTFADPAVVSVFVGTIATLSRKIGGNNVYNGNSLLFGFDMGVTLNPKLALNLALEQRYQSAQKVNGNQLSTSLIIPTIGIGANYAFTPKTTIGVNGSSGGSSQSPDAIFSLSLWQKF